MSTEENKPESIRILTTVGGSLKEKIVEDHKRLGYDTIAETVKHLLRELYFGKKAA